MALAPGAPLGTPDVMENGKWVNGSYSPGYKAPPATLPKGNLWDQWQNQNPAGVGGAAAAPIGAVWGGAPPMVSAPAAPAIPQAAIPTALNQVTNNRGFGGNDVDRTPYFAPFGMSTASAPAAVGGGVAGPGLMAPTQQGTSAIPPKTMYSGDDPRYKGLDAKTASTWAGEDIRSADREARVKANYDSQVARHAGDSANIPSWVTPEWQASHPLGVGRIPGMPEDKPYDWNDPYAYKGDANTQFGFNSYTDRTPKDFAKLVKYFGSTEAAMKWLTPNH